jgi:uncharacterized protein (TIGR03086 family)
MTRTIKASDGPALIAAAAAEASRVVAGTTATIATTGMTGTTGTTGPTATASLDGPTPCTDWDLRTLLNHTILWTSYSAERRAHGESVAEELMSKDFTAEPDYARDYQAQLARAVQAWSDPEAWERDLGVMGNSTPAADVAAMLVTEMVLHGWDIARATGQDYHCDPRVEQAVLETVQAQGDMFRQYQGFAAAVPVPGDAPAFDRALALSGRDPQWKPKEG